MNEILSHLFRRKLRTLLTLFAISVGIFALTVTGSLSEFMNEMIDLSAYAGHEVLIRFEYITDDAVNRAGFCVDDISIPELSYAHDVESGDDGWDGEGFVRTDNILPQRFIVQLIELGSETRVRRMALDELQQGRLELHGLGSTVERAVLIDQFLLVRGSIRWPPDCLFRRGEFGFAEPGPLPRPASAAHNHEQL